MKRSLLLFLSICSSLLLFTLYSAPSMASGAEPDALRGVEGQERVDQPGPPWFDAAWNYRRPINLENIGVDWLYYQVLIILDGNNFDFDLAREGGEDIRFTLGEGTISIPFWIESWDDESQLAYIWVRVPNLIHGSSTIYLYYDNPNAASASDGAASFDGFDDAWEGISGKEINQDYSLDHTSTNGIESPFYWLIIGGTPEVSPEGYLILENGTGIKSTATYQNLAVGFRANFGLGNGNQWAGFYNEDTQKRTMVGDRSNDPTNLYLRNFRDVEMNAPIQRVGGIDWHGSFHTFEVRWCIYGNNCDIDQSSVDVDHGIMETSTLSQVPDTALPVTLHNNNSGPTSELLIDWVYVRKYSLVEPTFSMGERQGLVRLSIEGDDSPDPLPIGKALTYHLSITNNGIIDAPGVVVTDTLPADMQLGEINASQGDCEPGLVIYCDLNTLSVDAIVNITIVVTPTSVDGTRINTALVGSPGYELDLSDNLAEQETLVDSVPPVVNWERPVQNNGSYTSYGGQVLLGASAADEDDLVDWVEFLYWDHLSDPPAYVSIGTDDTYPYQVFFDSDMLVPDQSYQLFVLGADRAGNRSDPTNPVKRILMIRRIANFMPLVIK